VRGVLITHFRYEERALHAVLSSLGIEADPGDGLGNLGGA